MCERNASYLAKHLELGSKKLYKQNLAENYSKSTKITKKQCPSWPTGREVMTTSSCWVRGYNSPPSPTVQSTPVNRTVEQGCQIIFT